MRLEEEGADGAESTYRVTDWEPLEVSIVAVPADATVGIGRSDDSSDHETEIEGEAIPAQPEAAALETTQEKSTMPHAATDTAVLEAQFRADVQKTERARVDAIIALGEAHAKRGMDKLAVEYVRNGKSLEEFRSAMLDKLAADTAETDTINLNQREAKEYSYVRAIAAALGRAEGQNVSGFEVEISQDIERNMPAN